MRRTFAVVVWLVASVVALLSLILCVTLILLPLGIPLFGLALRMYAYGVKLMLPHDVLPSTDDVGKAARHHWRRARKSLTDSPAVKKASKKMKKRTFSDKLTKALWLDALR